MVQDLGCRDTTDYGWSPFSRDDTYSLGHAHFREYLTSDRNLGFQGTWGHGCGETAGMTTVAGGGTHHIIRSHFQKSTALTPA